MAFDGIGIGGGPAIPASAASIGAALGAEVVAEVETVAAALDAAKAVLDAAEIVTSAPLPGVGVARAAVNVASAFVEELREALPGAKLTGDWTMQEVLEVKHVIRQLPREFAVWLHGVTFHMGTLSHGRDMRDDEREFERKAQERQMIEVDYARRMIVIRKGAMALPAVDGVPGFRLALTGELGKLAAAKPAHVQEFARLSGWTQTVRQPDGQLAAPPAPTAGAVPGEQAAAAPTRGLADAAGAPEVPVWSEPGRSPARPAGTRRLTETETVQFDNGRGPRRIGPAAPFIVQNGRAAEPAARAGESSTGSLPAGGVRPAAPGRTGGTEAGTARLGSGPIEARGAAPAEGRQAGPRRVGPAPAGLGGDDVAAPGGLVRRAGGTGDDRISRVELPTVGPDAAGGAPPLPSVLPATGERGAGQPAAPTGGNGGGSGTAATVAGPTAEGVGVPDASAQPGPTGPDAPSSAPGAVGGDEGGQVLRGASAEPTAGPRRVEQTGGAASVDPAVGTSGAGTAIGATGAGPTVGVTGAGPAIGTTSANPTVGTTGAGPAVGATGASSTAGEPGAEPTIGARGLGQRVGATGLGPTGVATGASAAGGVGRGPAVGAAGAGSVSGAGPASGVTGVGPAIAATGGPAASAARGAASGATSVDPGVADAAADGLGDGGTPAAGRGRGQEPPTRGPAASGRGRTAGTTRPAQPGEPGRGPGAVRRGTGDVEPARGGSDEVGARGVAGPAGRQAGPARAGGTAPLRPGASGGIGIAGVGGPRGGTPALPAVPVPAAAAPGAPEAIEGGGRVVLGDKKVLEFHHDRDAGFVGGPEARRDPRTDFGESLKAFLYKPELLMAKAAAKFLLLNADTRQYPPDRVRDLARAAGVDLGKVVADLLVSGKANQATISRICEYHGISADAAMLRAKDQEMLGRGANVEGLTARLALDIGANGPATAKSLREAEALADAFGKLAARLPVTRDPARVGLPEGNKVFQWLSDTAARLSPGGGRLARVDAEMAELRAQFQRLPLAAQLKVDPQLALGAAWFRFAPEERAMLKDPQAMQGLIARATERVDEVGYLPQRLNATEKRTLAMRTVVDALFDPGSAGTGFRERLGGAGGPLAALRELPARNGENVAALLGDEQLKSLGDKKAAAALNEALADPELADALATVRRGAAGAEQVRTALLRYVMAEGKRESDVVAVVRGAIATVKAEREAFLKGLDGGALELALTEVNRQVQEGNVEFVARFVKDDPAALEDALGPWVAKALSPSERKLLEDPDYRRHLIEDAKTLRATGESLAEEARQFRIQTENIQQTLDFLTRPDQTFRKEFEADPVGALTRRGIFPHLPDPVKHVLQQNERKTQLSQLTKAIEDTLAPIVQRQIGHQRQLENLRAAIKTVNAGNYKPLLGLLDASEAEMTRQVRSTLSSAMSHGDKEIRGGIISFL